MEKSTCGLFGFGTCLALYVPIPVWDFLLLFINKHASNFVIVQYFACCLTLSSALQHFALVSHMFFSNVLYLAFMSYYMRVYHVFLFRSVAKPCARFPPFALECYTLPLCSCLTLGARISHSQVKSVSSLDYNTFTMA